MKSHVLAVLAAACAALPALAMGGFTVDDALISVRYAHHVATGAGYRFDLHGPATDGVTPLPWPFLLAPFARGDAMTTLAAAKIIGAAAWTLAAAMLGAFVAREVETPLERRVAGAGLVVMALAFPIGAWAASGMETGVATALATVAVTRLRRPRLGALLAGLAAAFRPEMVAWAVVLAAGAAWLATASGEGNAGGDGAGAAGSEHAGDAARARSARARSMAITAAIAAAPFATCAAIRLAVFGRAAPLAVMAKPSDLSHGLLYTAAGLVVLLLPIFALAPVAIAKAPAIARVVAVAFVAHGLAVVGAGGDWMPYARLLVPVAPSLVVVVVLSSRASARWSLVARGSLAMALGLYVLAVAAPRGRTVYRDRADLVARARPVLGGARVVAALDVGWVSAATEARIVDLAGLTDPSIAVLPGGHTSKRVDASMLLDRDVEIVLVYSELRAVEARLVGSSLFRSRFEATEVLPLGSGGASYAVYRRRR